LTEPAEPVQDVIEPVAALGRGGDLLLLDVLLELAGAIAEPRHDDRVRPAPGSGPLLAEGVRVGTRPGDRLHARVDPAEQVLEPGCGALERLRLLEHLLRVHPLEGHEAALSPAPAETWSIAAMTFWRIAEVRAPGARPRSTGPSSSAPSSAGTSTASCSPPSPSAYQEPPPAAVPSSSGAETTSICTCARAGASASSSTAGPDGAGAVAAGALPVKAGRCGMTVSKVSPSASMVVRPRVTAPLRRPRRSVSSPARTSRTWSTTSTNRPATRSAV